MQQPRDRLLTPDCRTDPATALDVACLHLCSSGKRKRLKRTLKLLHHFLLPVRDSG